MDASKPCSPVYIHYLNERQHWWPKQVEHIYIYDMLLSENHSHAMLINDTQNISEHHNSLTSYKYQMAKKALRTECNKYGVTYQTHQHNDSKGPQTSSTFARAPFRYKTLLNEQKQRIIPLKHYNLTLDRDKDYQQSRVDFQINSQQLPINQLKKTHLIMTRSSLPLQNYAHKIKGTFVKGLNCFNMNKCYTISRCAQYVKKSNFRMN